jgi:molybdopterin molybdotransferase
MSTQSLMDIHTALALMQSELAPMTCGEETVVLDAAHGRIVAADVQASINVPPFAASAMDGYAVAAEDGVFRGDPPFELPVQAESFAGAAGVAPLAADAACRIFTGAPMPPRSSAVVMQEDCEPANGRVIVKVRPRLQQYVRPVGHDVPAGAVLLEAGTRLGVFGLARLAACGNTSVRVRAPLQVSIFSTGDELREPGEMLAFGQIYDANRFAIRQLLSGLPVAITDLGILPDDAKAIRDVLAAEARRSHVVLTSGGVSVGAADHVRAVVEELGSLGFWRVAIKPGKPIAYGRIGSAVFFGLPGNPVSTVITLLMLVKPILWQLAGGKPAPSPLVTATLAHAIEHDPGRAEFQRGRLLQADGRSVVSVSGDQSSNRLSSFHSANCLICIPRDCGRLEPGAAVDVLPFGGLLD